MTLSLGFNIIFVYVSILWILILVFPNWNITNKVMNSYTIFIPLGVLYAYYLLTTSDLQALLNAFIPQLSVYAQSFSQEGGALVVTIHFLAMDLFVGRWIYWQGQEKKIWIIHSLLLCLFFGPVGLLSHIITAYFFDKNNDPDQDDSDAEKAKTDTVVS